MKIKSLIFGFAGSVTVAIIYTTLALFLKLFPAQTLKFIGTVHMMPKLDYITSFIKVTPASIMIGIATHVFMGFLIFWLIATIYNLLEK